MPRLSVYMIRAAMIHMGIGFFFGAMVLFHKGMPLYDWTWKLLPLHIETMVYGWIIQFVMGIAFFILPRFSHRSNRYGKEYLGWLSFYLMNGGIIIALPGWWQAANAVLIGARLMMLTAAMMFVLMMWERVKPLKMPDTTNRSSPDR